MVMIIDVEALPIAVFPQGADATEITGRWAALMQNLVPVGSKAASGPMEEIILSGGEGEILANRLGGSHWLLLVLSDKAMLGRARHAVSANSEFLLRKI